MSTKVELKMQKDVHTAEKGDICFLNGKLISVADDCMMKVHKIENGTLRMENEIELPCGEVFSICTNQVDKIYLGGQSKVVEQFSFNSDKESLSKYTFEKDKSFLAMKFQSQVNKVRFNGSKWVLGFSDEEHMSIFNTETQKTIHCKPGHESCSVKSGSVDQQNNYVATTGTDGFLRIYKFSEDHSSVSFLTKVKICEKKVIADKTFDLDISWLEDGESIIVSGNSFCGFVQKGDTETEWELNHQDVIFHNSEITSLVKINDEVMATYSRSDKQIKVWRINADGVDCLNEMQLQHQAISLQWDNVTKTLAVMDSECNIGIFQKNYSLQTDEKEASQEQIVEQKDDKSKIESEVDEIDYDNIDMEMLEDEVAVEKKPQVDVPDTKVDDAIVNEYSKKIIETSDQKSSVIQSSVVQEKVSQRISKEDMVLQNQVSNTHNTINSRSMVQANQQAADQIDQFIDIVPQDTFLSNCKFQELDQTEGGYCVLAWNLVGQVFLRKTLQFTSVDVEFTDKNFHRNFSINDDFRCSMACLNYSGLVLAGKRIYQDVDQYEEDDLDDFKEGDVDKKSSYLYFKPLNEWETKKDWSFKMNEGESIESIASGTGWCACVTDQGFLRIFSHEGVQKQVVSQSSMIVTMAGYENLLIIVYHAGLPIYDNQQLKFKIINCGGLQMKTDTLYQTLYEGYCPISKRSSMTWMGFSEEGMLITMDDNGIVSGFNSKIKQWIPLLDLKGKYPETFLTVWIVGFMENEMLAIQVPSNCDQPPLSLKSLYKKEKLQIPLLQISSAQSINEEKIMKDSFFIDHEQYRKDVWEPLKHFRGRYDSEKVLSASILEARELTQKKKDFDKLILQSIKLCIDNDEHDKVFTYIEMIHFTASLKLCVKLCNLHKQNSLAQKVSKYLTEKEQRAVMENSKQVIQQGSAFDSRQMELCMQQKQTNAIEDVQKDKVDLSQFAVNTATLVASQEQVDEEIDHEYKSMSGSASKNGLQHIMEQREQKVEAEVAPQKVKVANPFAKSTDLAKKNTSALSTGGNDIFSGLHKPNAAKKDAIAQKIAQQKRLNPFSAGSGINKQRKIK